MADPEDPIDAAIRRSFASSDPPAAVAEDPIDAAIRRSHAKNPIGQQITNALPRMATVAGEAAQIADPKKLGRIAAEQQARFGDSPEGRRGMMKIQGAVPTLEAAAESPFAIQGLANFTGDPDSISQVQENIREAKEPKSRWSKMGGLEKFGHVMGLVTGDIPFREMLTSAVSDKKDFEPLEMLKGNTAASNGEYARTIEEAAGRDGNTSAKALDMLNTGLGALAGYPGAVIGAGTQALADTLFDEGAPADPWKQFGEVFRESPRTTKDAAAELAASPSMYFGPGGGAKGGAVAATGQAERIIPAAMRGSTQAERFVAGVGKIAGKYAGRIEMPAMIEKLATKHGVPITDVERVLGKNAEYLGKGQLTAGLPFISDKLTTEVVGPLDKALQAVSGGKLRAPEQLARKALAPVGKALYKTAPRVARAFGQLPPDWGANTNLAISREAAKGRNIALQNTAEELERFRTEVASLAPHDVARREEIVKAVLDPAYDVRKIADIPDGAQKWRPEEFEAWQQSWGKYLEPGELHVRPTKDEAGNRILVAVKPKPGEDPAAALQALRPRERQFVDALGGYLERQRQGLVAANLLDETDVGANLLTDRYFPRMWHGAEDSAGLLESAAPRGSGASMLKERGAFGGRALGSAPEAGIEAIVDPFEAIGKAQPKIEAAKQKSMFRQWAANHLGTPVDEPGLPHSLSLKRTHEIVKGPNGKDMWVPKEALAKMEEQFASSSRPNGIGGKAIQWMNARFKGLQTMGTPRYVFTNILGDSSLMAASGFRDARYFQRAGKLEKMADNAIALVTPTRNYTARELKEILRENGIWKGGPSGRSFEIDPQKGFGKIQRALQESAEGGARAAGELNDNALERALKMAGRRKTEIFEDVASMGWRRAGEKINDAWDTDAKTAYLMHRLERGDAPNIAIQRTFEVLPDYADQSKVIKTMSNFMAFPVWRMKALTNVPRIIARNPWSITATKAAIDLASDPMGDPAPGYAKDQSYNLQLGPAGRKLVGGAVGGLASGISKLSGAFGNDLPASPVHPGYGIGATYRTPLAEAITPMLEMSQGNPDPAASGLSPFLSPVFETLARRDYVSKQPLASGPLSVGNMFPSGMPGVPDALKTASHPNDPEQEIPYAARYLPQFFMSPQLQLAANIALGGDYLGRNRPTSPDMAQRLAFRAVNIGTGIPFYLTQPADQATEMQRDPAVQTAAEYLKLTKKSVNNR